MHIELLLTTFRINANINNNKLYRLSLRPINFKSYTLQIENSRNLAFVSYYTVLLLSKRCGVFRASTPRTCAYCVRYFLHTNVRVAQDI
jgi:hypothetical protein